MGNAGGTPVKSDHDPATDSRAGSRTLICRDQPSEGGDRPEEELAGAELTRTAAPELARPASVSGVASSAAA